MKIILTGGGTAGHINPAIAIAEEFKRRDRSTKILFIGRMGGAENEYVEKSGYDIKTLEIYGLQRKFTLKNIKNIFCSIKALLKSIRIVKSFSPDAVIGTGGYVCWPVLKAAQITGINTYIHESNLVPGLVTRMLEKGCTKSFVNMEGTKEYLKHKTKAVTTGTPIRSGFDKSDRMSARKMLGIEDNEIFIVSFGGSLGSQKMNDTITAVIQKYSRKKEKVKHLHATGKDHFDKYADISQAKNGCQIVPYIENMHLYLHACDLAICRCGASTLSELSYLGIPAILIPSPNVTDNHQYKNGKYYHDNGAAEMIEESDLTPESLIEKIDTLICNSRLRKNMKEAILKLSVRNSTQKIVDEITNRQ